MRNFLCKIGEKKWDSESAQKDIAVSGRHDFAIEHVTLWNIDKRLDDYMDSEEQHAIVIIDYMLDGDGSEEIPMHRASVRYARGLDKEKFVNALNANTLVGV